MRLSRYFGPSTLIAAAFIGPGTITTCTLAGVESGYALIWALVFSTFATIVLQEMSARLGFISSEGLGEAINKQFNHGFKRFFVYIIIISAILIGNAAYEAGNISGAVLGLELVFGNLSSWPIVVGSFCFILLSLGKYKWIESFLIALVILMSLCFLLSAIYVMPDIKEVFKGLVPKPISSDEFLLVMGLIGTTVVPYNLFLHASLISKKYTKQSDLKDIRRENSFSIIMGGIISILIVIVAAATRNEIVSIQSAKDLALGLEPLLGANAKTLMGLGLMAAGLSSALTAALAAAYVAKGLFNLKDENKSPAFKAVWIIILLLGTLVSLTKINMILIIKFAQIANAIVLPLLAGFLLYICNSKQIMHKYKNGKMANTFGAIVILLSIALSVKTLIMIF